MIPSDIFYTKFAGSYGYYAAGKKAYLSSVDSFIYKEANSPMCMIDVGSGDGKRGRSIADRLGIKRVTFLDSSDGMNSLSEKIPGATVIKADISDKDFNVSEKYDIVLCLWNVLGHISSDDARKRAVANLSSLLKDNGILFIDVNNRYNCKHYGKIAAARNVFRDIFKRKGQTGNFDLSFKTESDIITTKVHIFSPREIEGLILSAGLVIEKRCVLNYDIGRKEKRSWNGQLAYKVRKK